MKKHLATSCRYWMIFLFTVLLSSPLNAQNEPSGGMMRFPDVSKEHIAFVYAGDIWVVDRDGGSARPLASPKGQERFPRFSPDGQTIAFSGNYEGNGDVYTIPVSGGVAQRMTYHPANESVCDWMPEGNEIIYSSNGFAGLNRQPQLFTISSDRPFPNQLPVPYGTNGTVSSDGKWLAYTPHSRDGRTWKRYRGGMASDVWLFDLEGNTSKQITDFEGTDSLPMWHGKSVYYLSDNGPEARLNIWRYDTESGERTQVTEFEDFDCKWPSIGPGPEGEGEIVFSNGSDLKLLDLKSGESKSVAVTIPGDRPKLRQQKIDASEFIVAADISPKAKRVCVEARGDIWTLPAENGFPRNLTRSSGVAERSPSWSPDGRWIAYFSDESGEYELMVTQSDGRGETKKLTADGNCFRFDPVWSPDSKHIVFTDKTGAIYLHSLGGATQLVDRDPYADAPTVRWSHESSWLTYSINSDEISPVSTVWIYDVANQKKHKITNGFFNSTSPVFDREGNYLYFASSRAFDRPDYEDVGQSFVYTDTEVLLAVPLRADVELPMQPKNDEEEWEDESSEDDDEEEDTDEDKDEDDSDADSDVVSGNWSIELLNDQMPAEQRNAVLTLKLADDGTVSGSADTPGGEETISEGRFDKDSGSLTFSLDTDEGTIKVNATIEGGKISGTVDMGGQEFEFKGSRNEDDESSDDKKKDEPAEPFEIEFENIGRRIFQLPVEQGNFGELAVNHENQLIYARVGDGQSIKLFDMNDDEPEEKTVVSGSATFATTADGKKLLVFRDTTGYIVSASAGQKLDDEVPTDGMNVMIDPRVEWKQIFTDAWRIERDYFYDPTMHGTDWKAIHDRYVTMLDDCNSREDVGFVIGEMISELNVGHAYYRPGPDSDRGPQGSSVGLLGCTFEASEGHYRIAKIFEGSEWDTDARNLLRSANINEGEFILAVNDMELTDQMNPYAAFEGLAGRATTLTISSDAKLDDEDRRVVLKPLSSDQELRFRHWIEGRRKIVEEQTDGKVGYIYVVNTGVPGQNDLFRQFYGQMSKQALIIDDRWNGGGQIPTRFIELMNRPVTNYWAKRDGRDWTWPPDAQHGPKCMLTNGMAGSGGDMFPALFRQSGLGKLVGTRTWGGLVGISGNPDMIDGSGVTAPTFAYYEKDGTWGIEGHGVDPDIKVIDDPAQMLDGADPQLNAAIEHLKAELKSSAYSAPDRPQYPDRSKFGLDPKDK